MIHVVSIITVDGTEDEIEAINAIREAVAQINFGKDNLAVLTTSHGRDAVGQVAIRTLEGIAEHYDRALVVRCNYQFVPFIDDYPTDGGRPYPVNLNVSEISGIYNEVTRGY